jgi:hypothetical protein
MGGVGLEWQVAGFGDFSGNANESDMLMRDSVTGAFEVFDISNNHITHSAAISGVGLDWTVGGIAADPPTGSSSPSTLQLVQAVASFGASGGANTTPSNVIGGSDPSQIVIDIAAAKLRFVSAGPARMLASRRRSRLFQPCSFCYHFC